MRRCAIVVSLVGASACSFIFELPASDVSATTPDATPDVVEPDAEVIVRRDAGPVEAGPPFCASRTEPSRFCFDFDGEPTPTVAHVGSFQTKAGQIDVVNVVSFSAPRALLATVNGTDAIAAVTHSLGASPESVTLSFQQLVSTWTATAAQLSNIELTSGPSRCFVRLNANATTWSLVQQCTNNGTEVAKTVTDTSQPITRGRWQKFALSLTLAPIRTVTLAIDGTSVASVTPLAEMSPAPTSVTLGIDLAMSGGIGLFQDDVLVTSP